MDSQELKKLKMHLQGAMDCLAKYEMDDSTSQDEGDASDAGTGSDAAPEPSDTGTKSLKMKLLSFKNGG